eukprot:3553148-Amphidinium_carterae.1
MLPGSDGSSETGRKFCFAASIELMSLRAIAFGAVLQTTREFPLTCCMESQTSVGSPDYLLCEVGTSA